MKQTTHSSAGTTAPTTINSAAPAATGPAPVASSGYAAECLVCPGCQRPPALTFTASFTGPVTLWCGALRPAPLTAGGYVRCQLPRHIVAGGASEAAAVAAWNRRALDAEDFLSEADTGLHPVPPASITPDEGEGERRVRRIRRGILRMRLAGNVSRKGGAANV